MSELTTYEANVVRTTFFHFAKDKYLPLKRLPDAIRCVGLGPTPPELADIARDMDEERNALITEPAFTRVISKYMHPQLPEDEVMATFETIATKHTPKHEEDNRKAQGRASVLAMTAFLAPKKPKRVLLLRVQEFEEIIERLMLVDEFPKPWKGRDSRTKIRHMMREFDESLVGTLEFNEFRTMLSF